MSSLITISTLTADLRALGVTPGMNLMVHCAFKSLGQWVCGGAEALILALEAALGDTGTLIMPTHNSQLSEPSHWCNPPVPEAWWPTIRDQMPPFDPAMTPTSYMGLLAETFRKQAGVLRSAHPQVSFAARGPQAEYVLRPHALENSMGPDSPLGRLYALDGQVLFIGVGYDVCTSFHLAEHFMTPPPPLKQEGAPLYINGQRQWVAYHDFAYNGDPFADLGADFEADCASQGPKEVRHGKIAAAPGRLFSQRRAVDFAKDWLNR
jgi:aminoglycoside 3-N-acetyltransferase